MKRKAEGQGSQKSLKKLTEKEKIQLIELQKTRDRIVNELQKYSHLDMVEQLQAKPLDKNDTIYHKLGDRSTDSLTVLERLSKTNANPKPLNLDIVPMLAATSDLDSSNNKIKLPIFKLPVIEQKRILAEKKQRSLENAKHSNNKLRFYTYIDKKSLRKALVTMIKHLSEKEKSFICYYMNANEEEIKDYENQLTYKLDPHHRDINPDDKSIMTEFFSVDYGTTLFMTAKFGHHHHHHHNSHQPHHATHGISSSSHSLRQITSGTMFNAIGLTNDFKEFLSFDGSYDKYAVSRLNSADSMYQPGPYSIYDYNNKSSSSQLPSRINSTDQYNNSSNNNISGLNTASFDYTGQSSAGIAYNPPLTGTDMVASSSTSLSLATMDKSPLKKNNSLPMLVPPKQQQQQQQGVRVQTTGQLQIMQAPNPYGLNNNNSYHHHNNNTQLSSSLKFPSSSSGKHVNMSHTYNANDMQSVGSQDSSSQFSLFSISNYHHHHHHSHRHGHGHHHNHQGHAEQSMTAFMAAMSGNNSSNNKGKKSYTNNKKKKNKFDGEEETTESLTLALLSSLKQMDKHAKLIKQGLETAQDIVSIEDSKAKALVFTVAAERLGNALYMLSKHDMKRGIKAWKIAVDQARQQEKAYYLMRFLVRRNIIIGLTNIVHKVLQTKYTIWKQFTQLEIARIKREKIQRACVLIQKLARRRKATKKVAALKQRKKYQKLYDATIKIQALFKGKVVRWRYLKARRLRKEKGAATLIQKIMRAYLARKRVALMRNRRNKNLAATKIQTMVRCRFARKRVKALKRERLLKRSAMKIQKVGRGYIARRNIAKLLIERARYKYAVRIQALARGFVLRKNKARKIAEMNEYKYYRYKAAVKIQALYRGYRSRLMTRMVLYRLKKQRDEQFKAATAINKIVRGFNARRLVIILAKERHEQRIANARKWVEMWSEESEQWYYFNNDTQEALWEPCAEGYVKSDGRLVLSTGAIIDDPKKRKKKDDEDDLFFGDAEAKLAEKKKNSRLCSECCDRMAIRACNECGDKFCTKCYKNTHATGSRRNHTYKELGPKDCMECELVLAERWCVSCDEAYCDPCWRKVHSHGKRRFHPYSEVSEEGRVDPRIFTMDGEQLKDYDATYSQQKQDLEYDAQSNAEASTVAYDASGGVNTGQEEWSTYYDDQGYAYYYNNYTGVSQYENPYE